MLVLSALFGFPVSFLQQRWFNEATQAASTQNGCADNDEHDYERQLLLTGTFGSSTPIAEVGSH
jgi:hypothetical protein